MNIEIKKLSANDWQIFKELRLQMLKEEPQAFARTYDEVSKRTDEEWKENTENEEAGILAVWLDGKLAGMNGYYYPERSIVEIWGMFIRKEFRGMGLGKKLMGEIEKEIRKENYNGFVYNLEVVLHLLLLKQPFSYLLLSMFL